jgi:poly(A) polymerase
MIRKFIQRILHKRPKDTCQTVRAKSVNVRRKQISSGALKVVTKLQEQGYAAYIVGGAVRDAMLGQNPKDFDVATSARPEEVKRLFSRARIIGKRFRIVHVPFRDEIVEVTTFRGDSNTQTDATGRILRDNTYGSIEEDAARRDFTINALYYDPQKEEILDFHNGVSDLKARRLVMIGNPSKRYREDPVRILRAIRLAAKLHIDIDKATRNAIADCADLLHNIPSARLFDETLKMLYSGESLRCMMMLREEDLLDDFFPLFETLLSQPESRVFLESALRNTDTRIHQDKSVSVAFLFGTLLWYEVMAHWEAHLAAGEHRTPALFTAMDEVLEIQAEKLAIPRRFAGQMKEIWMLQPRFEQQTPGRVHRLLSHPRFRAGYDFLLLRAEANNTLQPLAQWWTEIQHVSPEEQAAMIQALTPPKKRQRRRRSSKKEIEQ